MKRLSIPAATRLLWMLAVCAAAALCCLLLFQYDNKYTASGPQAEDGVLSLDAGDMNARPFLFLVKGWEYYSGRLLAPVDFAVNPPAPDEIIYIGQYGGFEAGDRSASPHGSATYRLTVLLPEEPRSWAIELPEVYSAYRLYLNGEPAASMGEPEPDRYRPETGNRIVGVKAGGRLEILLAVSDFSHLYSGLTYPPAFGTDEGISALVSSRLIFRSLLVAFALAIGLLTVLVGLLGGWNPLALLYGLLCLCFVGFTAYPLWQAFPGAYQPLYALENFSYCALMAATLLLQHRLYGQKERWSLWFAGFGGLACVATLVLPSLLPGGKLWVVYSYSVLITVYQWLAAAVLTIIAFRALSGGSAGSSATLCGILLFDTALTMDRLLPLHGPIRTGWFPELGGFALVLCIGASVGREVALRYRESAVLSDRAAGMERLLELHRANYDLLTEQVAEAKHARHDLRHHLAVIAGFIQAGDYGKLSAYAAEYGTAIGQERLLEYTQNDVVNMLLHHYARLAAKSDIMLTLRLELDRQLGIADADLCAVLSNLLENALEACGRMRDGKRFVTLSMVQKRNMLSIHMENSTDGRVIFHGTEFRSSKGAERAGYGLGSVAAIAKRYDGEAGFSRDNRAGLFFSTVLLMERE